MRKNLRSRLKRGAAAIEFALLLPVFCAIMFGIIEYGWVFFQQANVIAAVRNGVRYAITISKCDSPGPQASAIERVKETLRGSGYSSEDVDSANITADFNGSNPTETLTVSADVPYHPLIRLIYTPPTLHGEMTMILELQGETCG